jgi:hypothetical protein
MVLTADPEKSTVNKKKIAKNGVAQAIVVFCFVCIE